MRIALVNPITRRSQGYHTTGSYIPQLGLQVLARLVPDEHDVEIIDEIFGTQHTNALLASKRYDLVGLTAYTSGAPRAYEIAAACREQGIQTVMGGPHAWACPEEAAKHVDSVAVGECDEVWPQIVQDAAAGRLEPQYHGTLSNLAGTGLGMAEQGIVPVNGAYSISAIQTSRGCPVGCEFCSVTRFNGAAIRRRDIADIIEEWNRTSRKILFVVDDNFFGVGPSHAEWAKELLRAIARHGKKRIWFGQTTINMGDDPEGLRLAYKAGCRSMLIGFETFDEQTLQTYHKGINGRNLPRYRSLISGFHRAGISVFGAFIIGSGGDVPQTVADTALAAVQIGVDIIQITNLTPLPGTRTFDRLRAEGHLLATEYPQDWERYTFSETVYDPKRMTARELDEAIYELRYGAAKQSWVWKRAFRTLVHTRSLSSAMFVFETNRGWKQMARVQSAADEAKFGFVPKTSARLDKIFRAFNMHLFPRVPEPVKPAPGEPPARRSRVALPISAAPDLGRSQGASAVPVPPIVNLDKRTNGASVAEAPTESVSKESP